VPFIHLLRAVGSHLIVWHHLAFYGPVSDIAYTTAPAAFDWLVNYARMAVQVFFVVGGFVTARKLSRPRQWTLRIVGLEILARYRRIGVPYIAALVVAVVANGIARRALDHDSISAAPSVPQLLAHVAFAQDLFHYEPLTAGIWYLAIDFQLGLLVLLVLAASQWLRGGAANDEEAGFRTAQFVFWPLAALSLYWLNRDERWDTLAPYFFGSYFGGMVVAWALAGRLPKSAVWAYSGLVAAALMVDWRPRLLVALVTGLAIFASQKQGGLRSWASWSWVNYWGERSYSLFLVHFPVCLVATALLAEYVDERPRAALGVMALEYALSLVAAIAFYRLIERRVAR
jgi:peptidoglycan/LPS O-acetylase OafA/YrhL